MVVRSLRRAAALMLTRDGSGGSTVGPLHALTAASRPVDSQAPQLSRSPVVAVAMGTAVSPALSAQPASAQRFSLVALGKRVGWRRRPRQARDAETQALLQDPSAITAAANRMAADRAASGNASSGCLRCIARFARVLACLDGYLQTICEDADRVTIALRRPKLAAIPPPSSTGNRPAASSFEAARLPCEISASAADDAVAAAGAGSKSLGKSVRRVSTSSQRLPLRELPTIAASLTAGCERGLAPLSSAAGSSVSSQAASSSPMKRRVLLAARRLQHASSAVFSSMAPPSASTGGSRSLAALVSENSAGTGDAAASTTNPLHDITGGLLAAPALRRLGMTDTHDRNPASFAPVMRASISGASLSAPAAASGAAPAAPFVPLKS